VEANHQIEDAYRLTTLQAPDSGTYLNQQSYSLEGELDVDAFQDAFRQVVERHTMLRTAFVLQAGGEPRQVVHRHAHLQCEHHDWRSVDWE
jgi:hypothetical protein